MPPIPPIGLAQQAIDLAGLLAEQGIIELTMRTPDGANALLRALETDLPRLFRESPPGTEFHWSGGHARVEPSVPNSPPVLRARFQS